MKLIQNIGRGKKVIVVGASMAGLLAARSLADHFEQVILLERDVFPAPGENRKGVPQGKHIHVLLELGRQIMENYLPGLTDELVRLGAAQVEDVSREIRWFHGGGFHQPGTSGVAGIGVSRPTLESTVRARVLALPNVRALENCNIVGLETSADQARVTGVRLVNRHSGGNEQTMPANLVVDASGRGSRSPVWLEALGYERPAVEEVRIGMGYTSCYYRRQPDHLPGLNGIVILATPPDRRLAVLMAQDGDRWVTTIGGYLGEHAPTSHQGFLESARRLPVPQIYNLIKDAELLSGPVAHTFPANLRHRYEKLARFPQGYLIIGDALCSFNPIYGQGMTVASLEAAALGECLKNGGAQLAKRFFAKASKIIDASWNAAVGSDLGFQEVKGLRTPMVRFLNWYIARLHNAAHNDSKVSIAFLKVINMVSSPASILRPDIIWRVAKGSLQPDRHKTGAGEEQIVSPPTSVAPNR